MIMFMFLSSCKCIGQTSFGVSTRRQLRVRFPRVISPCKSLFDKNAELSYCMKRVTSRMILCLDGMTSRHLH